MAATLFDVTHSDCDSNNNTPLVNTRMIEYSRDTKSGINSNICRNTNHVVSVLDIQM